MIDCHCHFYCPQFQEQEIPALAATARAAGVQAIVTVPESLQDCHQPLHGPGAGQFYSGCRSVQQVSEVEPVLQFIRQHAEQLVGIGEVGLDFSPHVLEPKQPASSNATAAAAPADGQGGVPSSRQCTAADLKDVQRAVFQQQVQLANELGLPVNVHSRSAGHHAITLLIENNAQAALLHAFDGRPAHALRGAQAGYYFSVPPSIVRSEQKQRLVAALPLDCLVLETDAPALGPDKDAANVPANITISAQQVARIKGLAVEVVVRITTENAKRLFTRLKLVQVG